MKYLSSYSTFDILTRTPFQRVSPFTILYHSIYIRTEALSYSLALILLISSWLVLSEVECTVHKPKWPINQLEPTQQSRQQVIKAYCPNIYTVTLMLIGSGSLPVGLPKVPVAQIIAKIAKNDTNLFISNFQDWLLRSFNFLYLKYSVYRKKKEEGSIFRIQHC